METTPPAQPADPAPTPVNHPPEISGTPAASVQAGQAYSFTPTASDADNDFLEFSATNMPAWAQFSAETGALTGTPGDAHVGETQDITITVTDGRDTRSIGPFRIRINPRDQTPPPSNAAPTISGAPATSVMVNQAYSFQPSAADANGDALTLCDFQSSFVGKFQFCRRAGSTGTPAALERGDVLEHRDQRQRRARIGRAAGVRDSGARSRQSSADDQRRADDQRAGDAGIFVPAGGERCGQRSADVLDRESSVVGELQHIDRPLSAARRPPRTSGRTRTSSSA